MRGKRGASEPTERPAAAALAPALPRAAAVLASPGVLKPAPCYRWQGRGASAQARARQGLRAALAGSSDPASLALLGEVDRGLGLLREAGETFARALALGPGNAALAATVERLDARLRPPPPE